MQSWLVGSSLVFLGLTGFTSTAYSQVDVTASSGTLTGTYTTLKGAFDAINAGTHQGAVVVGISANTTETAPAVLNSNGAGPAIYTSVMIQPTADGVTISGATTAGRGLIELKGADNVTLDGDNPNTAGTNRNLTLTNTAAATIAYTSVIRIANTATVVASSDNIAIRNLIINGNATGRNAAANTSTTGSENTTFGIYAGGNGGATAIDAPTALTNLTSTVPNATTVNDLIVSNNQVNAVARAIVFNGNQVANSNVLTVTNNVIGDQSTLSGNAPFTTPATTVYVKGIYVSGTASVQITGNTIKNILSYVGTPIAGIELNTAIGSGTLNIANNTITGVALNVNSANSARGISILNAAGAYTVTGNTVSTIQNFCSNTTTTNRPTGIFVATSAPSAILSNNRVSKVYDLNTGTYGVSAFWLNGGNNITVQNNFIYDVSQDITGGAAFSTGYGVNGLFIGSGTGHKIYHNSIHLSGALLGTSTTGTLTAAIAIGATSATGLDIRNNIFSNTMTGGTTSIAHVAIFLPSGATSAMNLTLNNNAYYSGTDAARQGIAQVGTTAGVTFYLASNFVPATAAGTTNFRNYTNALSTAATNDNKSIGFSAAAPFVSATNLHISTGVTPTQLESGGAAIGVAVDIDGEVRPGPTAVNGGGTAPDMGADEFDGAPLAAPVITLNSVTPAATPQCVATARVISVNISNPSGPLASVNLAYTINGVAQSPIAMTNSSGTTWTATIPAPTPANAVIAWGVAATNSFALTGTYTGTSYSDEPASGAIASATSSAGPVCAGSNATLTAQVIKPAAVPVGAGALSTSGSGNSGGSNISPFSSYFGGYKFQYVVRASELTAAGLVAGNLTALAFDVVSASAIAYTGLNVNIASTASTVATTTYLTGTFTNVYSGNPVTTPGVYTFPFSTPFNWDGTSNIVVEICWSNNNGGSAAGASEVKYDATSFVSTAYYRNDSQTPATICGRTTADGTHSNRPKMTFTGNAPVAGLAVSWSDGVATVGTTNPLTVNPTATTTYTAAITVSGCPVTPSPTTTVTVNPLPSAPTATNSAQCGVQIPTASVTSTTGFATPTFSWYAASSGGSFLQSSTSATYTSTVSATTTFYVSELNTATGCESTRTPVTVNVSTPDAVSLVHSPAAICIGGSITLTAANTNPTPFQSYTYSTVSTTGSGLETPSAGATLTVTPTAAGTYTYTVTATDGGCAASATTTVSVNALPAITTATATPATVCSGDAITLTATSLGSGVGQVAVGAGALNGSSDYYSPFYHNFGGVKGQYIIRASELTAAGLVAGNITALGITINATAGITYSGFTVHIGTTANTDLAGGFVPAAGLTQVYSNAAQTFTASSLNNFTFVAPFAWDGTSNIVVQTSWSNNNSGGNSAGVRYDNTAYVSNAYYRVDNGTVAAVLGATTNSGTMSARPRFTFTGNSNSLDQTASLNWAWTPGAALNTATATTSITNNTGSPMSQVFTVTATNPVTGCVNTGTTAAVTINPAPLTPVASNSTQCGTGTPTASVTGSGTPGNTFAWYTTAVGGTAIAGQTANMLTAYPVSATTTFYVSESNATCSSPRVAVTVTVTTPPAIAVSGTATICLNGSTALTASSSNDPNYTYTWSGGLGTGATVTAAPTATTTYTVTAVDASGGANNGCNTSATYAITVNPIPTALTATVNDNTICVGEAVNLSSTGNSNSAVVSTTILTQNFDAGFGTWTTVNGGASPAVSNWVSHAPLYTSTNFGANFTNFNTPQGGQFALSNSADGGSGSTTNTKLVSPSFSTTGMTSATLTFQNLYKKWNSGDATVAVEISTDNGSTWAVLKDYLPLGNQGTTTDNGQIPANESITLGAAYLNQANVKIRYNYVSAWGYYWIIDNVSITGQQPAVSTIAWTSSPAGFTSAVQNPAAVSPTATTTYTVTYTNSFSCSASASVAVTVNALPTVGAGADQTVCAGTPVTLSGSGADTYVWNNSVVNGTAFTPAATTTYTVTGTDLNGCTNTDDVTVTVNPLPTVNAGADQTVCAGTPVTLTGTGTATGYSWNNGVSNGVAFTPTATTTYTLTGTDANLCSATDAVTITVTPLPVVSAGADFAVCDGATATLSGSGADGFVWDNSVTDGVAFTPAATTTYTVTGTTDGCSATDAVTVTVNDLPTANAGVDQAVCAGTSVVLIGTGTGISTWDNGVSQATPFTPTATTTYTVTVDNGTCTNTDQVTVTVNDLPTANAGADQAVCAGTAVTLTATGTGTFSWDNDVDQATPFTPTATATYTVTVDNGTCTNTDQVTVTVNEMPTVSAGADQTVCAGTMITLTGTGTAAGYGWNNGVSDGVAFAATTTTTYTVTGTTGGCSATDDVTITVVAAPTVNGGADQAVCAGTAVTLTATGTGTFSWNNGVSQATPFIPTTTATYTVTVNNGTCTVTDQVTVTVNALPVATATLSGNVTLTASTGTTYQWLNCATNTAIAGATSQTFLATANGSYSVVVTNASGCSDTSACVAVTSVGIKEIADASINVFPNPTANNVTVTMSSDNASVEVADAQGKVLQVMTISNGGTVDLSAYGTGVYFLRIKTETGSAIERVVKN